MPYGRSTVDGSVLFAMSSCSVSAAPQRATQRATSQRGCECASASASTGSVSVGSVRASRSRSTRRSTALASLLAPIPWRCFASSTVCAIAAYAGTLRMESSWYAPSRSRSPRSGSSRTRPPFTRSLRYASRMLRCRSIPNTSSCVHRRSRASSGPTRASKAMSRSLPLRRSAQRSAAMRRESVTPATGRTRVGGRSVIRASPQSAMTAPRPRAAACGRRDTPVVPRRRRGALRAPCERDRRPRRARCS